MLQKRGNYLYCKIICKKITELYLYAFGCFMKISPIDRAKFSGNSTIFYSLYTAICRDSMWVAYGILIRLDWLVKHLPLIYGLKYI